MVDTDKPPLGHRIPAVNVLHNVAEFRDAALCRVRHHSIYTSQRRPSCRRSYEIGVQAVPRPCCSQLPYIHFASHPIPKKQKLPRRPRLKFDPHPFMRDRRRRSFQPPSGRVEVDQARENLVARSVIPMITRSLWLISVRPRYRVR